MNTTKLNLADICLLNDLVVNASDKVKDRWSKKAYYTLSQKLHTLHEKEYNKIREAMILEGQIK